MGDTWRDRAIKAENYASDYGNAVGTCDAGYWQHPNYICHHCKADNRRECKEMAKAQKTAETHKLQIKVVVTCEYEISSLDEISGIQETLERALEEMRSYGKAEAVTSFDLLKKAHNAQ